METIHTFRPKYQAFLKSNMSARALCGQIEMIKRLGMDIPPATVSDWFKDVADLLKPLYYRIRDLVMDTDYIQAVET